MWACVYLCKSLFCVKKWRFSGVFWVFRGSSGGKGLVMFVRFVIFII